MKNSLAAELAREARRAAPAKVFIRVEVPGGMVCSWEALSRKSALRQAKFEAECGALVTVKEGERVIWTNAE